MRGVPHVQCPMWPPAQVTPTSDIPISWIFPSAAIHHPVRYSDCSSRYLFIPDILRLHICLHQISDGVLYRYWAEVKSEEWISDPSNLALSSLVCVCRATFSISQNLHICSKYEKGYSRRFTPGNWPFFVRIICMLSDASTSFY